MSASYLLAGIFVLLFLSADGGDAYIISHSKAEADQLQNDDFGLENEEDNGNSKVNNGVGEKNEGEEKMFHDVDETGQENAQYHDAEDSSNEEYDDDVDHHGGHDQEEEDGEEIDFGDNMDEHHFANSGFEVDVTVHVGGHHGADEHYFGGDGEYDVEKDDDNDDDDDDDKEDHGMKRDDEEDRDDQISEKEKHRLVPTDDEDDGI